MRLLDDDATLTTEGSQLLIATAYALVLASFGYNKRSLNASGALTAFFTGVLTFFTATRFGMVLIAFFMTSSQLTKFKSEAKRRIEHAHKEGGQRNWIQVLCNSLPANCACVAFYYYYGEPTPFTPGASWRNFLLGAFLGHYACCCGDTWASELGVLSSSPPTLITTCRPVPKGTNGGVSLHGTLASLGGGLTIGIVYYMMDYPPAVLNNLTAAGVVISQRQWIVLVLAPLLGVVGSVIDSVLGATVQFSGLDMNTKKVVETPGPDVKPICGVPLLDNHAVNLLAASITAVLSGTLCCFLF